MEEFNNIKFNDKLYNTAAIKWKEFPVGIYRTNNKSVVASKFGQSYILKLR